MTESQHIEYKRTSQDEYLVSYKGRYFRRSGSTLQELKGAALDRFLFPKEALREAVLNAIIHKDYSLGVPIQISVYDDKLVIWNSGQLPEQWTLQDFYGKHPSSPFNPIVANAFFRAGFIESWGRGIEKIRSACQRHEIKEVAFDTRLSGMMVKLLQAEIVERTLPEKPNSRLQKYRLTEKGQNLL